MAFTQASTVLTCSAVLSVMWRPATLPPEAPSIRSATWS
jgi:hypothetical protein